MICHELTTNRKMEEEIEKLSGNDSFERDEVFSKAVRAGKRTYFFDVKATKRNDYYITITESKKKINREGRFFFEKHKIFLYKEDFEKFVDNLNEVVQFVRESNPVILDEVPQQYEEELIEEFVGVEFEDLDNR